MLDILQYTFFQHALAGALLASLLCAMIGTYVVTRRLVIAGGGVAHASLGGVGIGAYFGFPPLLGAAAFALLSGLSIHALARRDVREDSAIAMLWTFGMSVGIMAAYLTPGFMTELPLYLFGDILSVTPGEIGMLALVLLAVIVFWIFYSNRLTLTAIHPQLASSRGIPVGLSQTLFTAAIAVVVTLSISSVGLLILNSLLVLPGASARNVARNLKQYHGFSVLFAFLAGVVGLTVSYYSGCSAGAAISLGLAAIFAVTFCLRKVRA